MVVISVGVIMRMYAMLVLAMVVLAMLVLAVAVLAVVVLAVAVFAMVVFAVVVFAVVRWAMVVGHHGGRPSVVVPTMMMCFTEVGVVTRLGGVFMVVSLTLAMEPTIVGNLSVVMKPTMVVGLPVLVEPSMVVGLPVLAGPPMVSPAMVVLMAKVVLTIGLVGDESVMGRILGKGCGTVVSTMMVGLTMTGGVVGVVGMAGEDIVMEVLEFIRVVRSTTMMG